MAVDRWAIIEDATGKVANVCVWDGVTRWQPPAGHTVRKLDTPEHEQACEPGSQWDGTRFTRPDRRPSRASLLASAVDVQARIDALGKLDPTAFPSAAGEITRLQSELATLTAAARTAIP